MSDQNTDNHEEVVQRKNCTVVRRQIFPVIVLEHAVLDMQANDDGTDVVNRESVRTRNTIDIEALILKFVRQEVVPELAFLTAQMKGSLDQASSGPIRCRFRPFRAITYASQVHPHITCVILVSPPMFAAVRNNRGSFLLCTTRILFQVYSLRSKCNVHQAVCPPTNG